MTTSSKLSRVIVPGALLASLVCLYVAREVVVPVALAGLFTFLLSPVDKALQKRGMARGLSVGLITTVSLLLVGAIAWVVAEQVTDFAGQLPMYKGNIRKRIDDLRWDGKGTALAKASDTVKELAGEVATNSASTNAQATPAPVPVTVQRGTTQTALSVLTPVMETQRMGFASWGTKSRLGRRRRLICN